MICRLPKHVELEKATNNQVEKISWHPLLRYEAVHEKADWNLKDQTDNESNMVFRLVRCFGD